MPTRHTPPVTFVTPHATVWRPLAGGRGYMDCGYAGTRGRRRTRPVARRTSQVAAGISSATAVRTTRCIVLVVSSPETPTILTVAISSDTDPRRLVPRRQKWWVPAEAESGIATVAEKSPRPFVSARPTTVVLEWKVSVTVVPGAKP